MKKSKLAEKVERAYEKFKDTKAQQKNLEKAMKLDEQFSDVKPKPFPYSIKQANGLPYQNKAQS